MARFAQSVLIVEGMVRLSRKPALQIEGSWRLAQTPVLRSSLFCCSPVKTAWAEEAPRRAAGPCLSAPPMCEAKC